MKNKLFDIVFDKVLKTKEDILKMQKDLIEFTYSISNDVDEVTYYVLRDLIDIQREMSKILDILDEKELKYAGD